MHSFLGDYPGIVLQKTCYFPYSDTALFGSYIMGNEVFATQCQNISQYIITEYASYVIFCHLYFN